MATNFPEWVDYAVLSVLAAAIQRLGGRENGPKASGLQCPFLCDISRMILAAVKSWTKPEVVDQIVQLFIITIKS